MSKIDFTDLLYNTSATFSFLYFFRDTFSSLFSFLLFFFHSSFCFFTFLIFFPAILFVFFSFSISPLSLFFLSPLFYSHSLPHSLFPYSLHLFFLSSHSFSLSLFSFILLLLFCIFSSFCSFFFLSSSYFFFIIQRVKADVIPCPHQPPTRGDNTVLIAQGGTATPGATKQFLPLDRVLRELYIYIYI